MSDQGISRLITVDEKGLNIPDIQQTIEYLKNNLQQIYGNDVDFSQNTPDGQMINIITQVVADLGEILLDIYNGFDPKLARGSALDRDVAYNGIYRNGGSYTIQPVIVSVNRPVVLPGLDEAYNDPQGQGFTVSDAQGNQWILITTATLYKGASLNFRAANLGPVTSVPNTITNIVTPVAGVTSVVNIVSAIEEGTLQESDEHLAYRREQSTALGGVGSVASIQAALLNTPGVTLAFVAENETNETDTEHDMQPHSIWVIVQGGSTQDIGKTLYNTVNQGVYMKGTIKVEVDDPWGKQADFYFDRPEVESLFITFAIIPKSSATEYDENYIKEQLIERLNFGLYDTIDANTVTCLLKDINNELIYSNLGLSNVNGSYKQKITNKNYNYIFSLGPDNIIITR